MLPPPLTLAGGFRASSLSMSAQTSCLFSPPPLNCKEYLQGAAPCNPPATPSFRQEPITQPVRAKISPGKCFRCLYLLEILTPCRAEHLLLHQCIASPVRSIKTATRIGKAPVTPQPSLPDLAFCDTKPTSLPWPGAQQRHWGELDSISTLPTPSVVTLISPSPSLSPHTVTLPNPSSQHTSTHTQEENPGLLLDGLFILPGSAQSGHFPGRFCWAL